MKGLLSVSFGTSYAETREKTIDAIDAQVAAAFPNRAFYAAWTSGRIAAKVQAERGEHHDTLEEAFARISEDGVDDLIVSTSCLMNGWEMSKITKAAQAWAAQGPKRKAFVADPLLLTPNDRKAVARAVYQEHSDLPEGDALLLMGHGSPGGPNEVYAQIQDEIHELGRPRFFVATVEGEPTLDDVLPLLEECAPACVHLAPLMIVAGDHATNDLAGDDGDSWKSRCEERGLQTRIVLRGLGEYAGIRKLICDHAAAARPLAASGEDASEEA